MQQSKKRISQGSEQLDNFHKLSAVGERSNITSSHSWEARTGNFHTAKFEFLNAVSDCLKQFIHAL
jgi:hypothetical protein